MLLDTNHLKQFYGGEPPECSPPPSLHNSQNEILDTQLDGQDELPTLTTIFLLHCWHIKKHKTMFELTNMQSLTIMCLFMSHNQNLRKAEHLNKRLIYI